MRRELWWKVACDNGKDAADAVSRHGEGLSATAEWMRAKWTHR